MYHESTQGIYEHMINGHYYIYMYILTVMDLQFVSLPPYPHCHSLGQIHTHTGPEMHVHACTRPQNCKRMHRSVILDIMFVYSWYILLSQCRILGVNNA